MDVFVDPRCWMEKILGLNWKTTVGGVAAAAGTGCQMIPSPKVQAAGMILSSVGLVLLGVSARDKNVSTVQMEDAKQVEDAKK